MDLSTRQRWTFLVALENQNTARYVRAALHPVHWPPYILAATHGEEHEGKIRVEVTIGGRDRWEVQHRVELLAGDMVDRPGSIEVLDITTIKGQVTRPRGGSRGYKPNVALGEVPAGPPRPSRSCRRCDHRPRSTGRWSQQYGGAGR